jgi:hypothetical protein
MILSPAQLRDLAASVGFPDPSLAAAVAMAESYGHTDASNIVTPSMAASRTAEDPSHPVGPEWSLGVWQINSCARWQGDSCVSFRYDQTRLLDATYNAQVAYAISNGGANWRPWGGYTNGGYRQYLPAGYVPPPAPATPQPPFAETVTPPAQNGSTALIAVSVLAMTAAAGFAVYQGRRVGREPSLYP